MIGIGLKANRTASIPVPVLLTDGFKLLGAGEDTLPIFALSATSPFTADVSFDAPLLYDFMAPTVSFWSPVPDAYQVPKNVFIQDLGRPDLTPTRPIPVSLEYSPGGVIAHCFDLDEFGVGSDESAALDDLRASLASLYRSLQEEADNLGPLPRKHWDYLRRMITEG